MTKAKPLSEEEIEKMRPHVEALPPTDPLRRLLAAVDEVRAENARMTVAIAERIVDLMRKR